jgi:hypothetical protein
LEAYALIELILELCLILGRYKLLLYLFYTKFLFYRIVYFAKAESFSFIVQNKLVIFYD